MIERNRMLPIFSLQYVLLLTLCLFTACAVNAQTKAPSSQSAKEQAEAKVSSPLDKIEAGGYILIEADTGMILANRNPLRTLEPASITKLMTAYVVYQAIESGEITLETKTEISPKARQMNGSRMFLEQGTWVSIDNLLSGLVIQSGNDAAVALAEAVSATEPEFVKRMNAAASALGMKSTQFKNSSGMPEEGHVTTAKDIAILSRAIIKQFPEFYKRYKRKAFTWNKVKQENRNRLLWVDPRVDGLKTGHTENAGYCLAASAINSRGMRLISVVLGTKSTRARTKASQALLDYGFREFEYKTLYEQNKPIIQQEVYLGDSAVAIAAAKTIRLPLPKTLSNSLNAQFIKTKTLEAPIAAGEVLGKILVTSNGQKITEVAAVATNAVNRVGFFSRLWRRTSGFVSGLF